MLFPPDQLILNNEYRVIELAGQGAYGEVYRVARVGLDVERAIKVLRADMPGVGSTKFDDYRKRFELEAKIGAQLETQGAQYVVKVYDFKQFEGTLFLLMEYMTGGTLQQRLTAGPLPIEDAARILLDAAHGLSELHVMGIIHRDVKPGNILFDRKGRAKIGDLGLVQLSGGEQSMRSQMGSAAGLHPGTPNYRSPEHNGWEPLGPTSDIYSLGCVAFEMLTGRIWKQAMMDKEHIRDWRPEAPEWLNAIVARMLIETPGRRASDANDSNKRYVTIESLTSTLQQDWDRAKWEQREREAQALQAKRKEEAVRQAEAEAVRKAREAQAAKERLGKEMRWQARREANALAAKQEQQVRENAIREGQSTLELMKRESHKQSDRKNRALEMKQQQEMLELGAIEEQVPRERKEIYTQQPAKVEIRPNVLIGMIFLILIVIAIVIGAVAWSFIDCASFRSIFGNLFLPSPVN